MHNSEWFSCQENKVNENDSTLYEVENFMKPFCLSAFEDVLTQRKPKESFYAIGNFRNETREKRRG